jgi:hypothetical protein
VWLTNTRRGRNTIPEVDPGLSTVVGIGDAAVVGDPVPRLGEAAYRHVGQVIAPADVDTAGGDLRHLDAVLLQRRQQLLGVAGMVGDEVAKGHAIGRVSVAAARQGVRAPIDHGWVPAPTASTDPSGPERVTEGDQDLAPLIGPHDAQVSALDLVPRLSRVDGPSAGEHRDPACLTPRRRFSRPRRCQTYRGCRAQRRQRSSGSSSVTEHRPPLYGVDTPRSRGARHATAAVVASEILSAQPGDHCPSRRTGS